MKLIKPGCNEHGWSAQVQCVGSIRGYEPNVGCGAILEITKADLRKVRVDGGMSPDRYVVIYTCIGCQVHSAMENGRFFVDLPVKEK